MYHEHGDTLSEPIRSVSDASGPSPKYLQWHLQCTPQPMQLKLSVGSQLQASKINPVTVERVGSDASYYAFVIVSSPDFPVNPSGLPIAGSPSKTPLPLIGPDEAVGALATLVGKRESLSPVFDIVSRADPLVQPGGAMTSPLYVGPRHLARGSWSAGFGTPNADGGVRFTAVGIDSCFAKRARLGGLSQAATGTHGTLIGNMRKIPGPDYQSMLAQTGRYVTTETASARVSGARPTFNEQWNASFDRFRRDWDSSGFNEKELISLTRHSANTTLFKPAYGSFRIRAATERTKRARAAFIE